MNDKANEFNPDIAELHSDLTIVLTDGTSLSMAFDWEHLQDKEKLSDRELEFDFMNEEKNLKYHFTMNYAFFQDTQPESVAMHNDLNHVTSALIRMLRVIEENKARKELFEKEHKGQV
jgi:hypothetical protein